MVSLSPFHAVFLSFIFYHGTTDAYVLPSSSSSSLSPSIVRPPSTIFKTTTTTTTTTTTVLSAVKKSFDYKTNRQNNSDGEDGTNERGIRHKIRKLRIRQLLPLLPRFTNNSIDEDENGLYSVGPATTYIPDGLTQAQYSRLKEQEAKEESNKNYGAWGPRFAPGNRPNGDWMVLPQLWTQGAVDGPPLNSDGSSSSSSNMNEPSMTPLQRLGQKIPAIVLAVVMLDSIATAIAMYKALTVENQTLFRKLMSLACRLPLWKRWWKRLAFVPLTRIHAIKALAVLFAAPLIDRYILVPVNRYRLWSKQQTVTLSTLGSIGLLGIWALFLGTMKQVGFL